MKQFLDKDFLLQTDTAKQLYHNYASQEPIFDFHNHLSAREIYEDKSLGNLANAWLDHDHYKWRAMRAAGVPESVITGHLKIDGSVKSDEARGGADAVAKADYERYMAFVRTLQGCIGNPLYHWSHLELQRYFGITEPLTEKNAKEVWDKCNELLAKKEFGPRGLLTMLKVKALCTTDDPIDNLEWHKKLAAEWKDVEVRPSFRPDFAINAENKGFGDYIAKLENVIGKKIKSIGNLIEALGERIDYFKECGCLVSDHSLENDFYEPATMIVAEAAFKKARKGLPLTKKEICEYKTYLLISLGNLYREKGLVMQIHIGALRDNSTRLLMDKGKNIGLDSLQDFNYAPQLSGILNGIDFFGGLPKVILYNLNPKDNEALATMAANYNSDSKGVGRVQFGPAWWFNDHKDGIEEQIRVYARTSVLSGYVGMLTDSRSFLSYPRHEYFRRILCNFIGNLVENGEYPWNEEVLGEMVRKISYKNSVEFFKIK